MSGLTLFSTLRVFRPIRALWPLRPFRANSRNSPDAPGLARIVPFWAVLPLLARFAPLAANAPFVVIHPFWCNFARVAPYMGVCGKCPFYTPLSGFVQTYGDGSRHLHF
jgi:hypothetical protein